MDTIIIIIINIVNKKNDVKKLTLFIKLLKFLIKFLKQKVVKWQKTK